MKAFALRLKGLPLRFIHSSTGHWLVCLLTSGAYVALMYSVNPPEATASWVLPLMLILPGLLTFILVPKSIRKWYRWVVILFLSMTVHPAALMQLVLVIGVGWALYRSWFAERPLPLKEMFALRKQPKGKKGDAKKVTKSVPDEPAKAETPQPKKPTTVAEVIAAEKANEEGVKPKAKAEAKAEANRIPARELTKKQKAAATQAAKSATAKAAQNVG